MKKDMKKFLAISALSLGFLSSTPSALCAPKNKKKLEYFFSVIMAPYINNKDDLKNFAMACKKFGTTVSDLRKNPYNINFIKNRKLFPGMETFEDHQNYFSNTEENINDNVNRLDLNSKGKLKTLIYYPGSFDVERFHTILSENGIAGNLRYAIKGKLKDSNGEWTEGLCGEKWARIIYPFDGMSYRVEYIRNYKKPLTDPSRRKIVFLFNPTAMVNNNVKKYSTNAFNIYNDFVNACGLKELSIDISTINYPIIPSSVTSIGSRAFARCINLEEINIPYSVKSIGDEAFSGCYSLSKVEIPDSITEIGKCAFSMCKSLKEITIPNNVTEIKEYAFLGCMLFKKIDIPNKVKSIGGYAFWKCLSLQQINIPNSVETIGDRAFWECQSLREITIPDNVIFIGKNAFEGCTALGTIKWRNNEYHSVGEFFEAFERSNRPGLF